MPATQTPIPVIEKGYYRLTKDIENPKPDGRNKRRMDSRKVWPKGTLVKAIGPGDGRVGMATFDDGSFVMFGGTGKSRSDQRVGDELARNLEPAPDTLAIVLKEAGPSAADVLAFLIDTGAITLDAVKAAVVGIDALDPTAENPHVQSDDGYNELRRRHGLGVFGE